MVLAYAAYKEWMNMGQPGVAKVEKQPLGESSGALRMAGMPGIGCLLVGFLGIGVVRSIVP